MAETTFSDLSFLMQSLDNTSTVTVADGVLRADWTTEGKIADDIDEAVAELTRAIIDLQLNGDATEYRRAGDQISIHRSPDSFVSQFSVDARDDANRVVTILCYGRLPRADDEKSKLRGRALLRAFLEDQGIELTPTTEQRYQFVCCELAHLMEPGLRILGRTFRLPRLRMPADAGAAAEQEPVIRLGQSTGDSRAGEMPAANPAVRPEPVEDNPGAAFASDVDGYRSAEPELASGNGPLGAAAREAEPARAPAEQAPPDISPAEPTAAASPVTELAGADDLGPGGPQDAMHAADGSDPNTESEPADA